MSFSLLRRLAIIGGLVVADILAFTTGYYLFRYGHPMPMILLPEAARGVPNMSAATDIYLILAFAFVIIRYLLGDYGKRQFFWDSARVTSNTLVLVAIPDVSLVLLMGTHVLYWPLVLSWLFLFPAIPIYRQIARRLMAAVGLWQIPSALIGTGPQACAALAALRGALSLGFDVRFLIVNDPEAEIPAELQSLKQVRPSDPAAMTEELLDLGCGQVITAADDTQGSLTSEILQRLIGAGINVAVIPFFRGLPLYGLSTNYLFGKDLLLLQLRNNLSRVPSRVIKRIVDLIGPLLVIVLASPVWMAIMIAIKLSDDGPIFFVQQRVGTGGRLFPCIKFRTMRNDAEDMLNRWPVENPALHQEYLESNFKLKNDPRVTRVGRWLRRTSLDELPQVLNVLVGQMSLVGPRPLIEREIRDYGAGFELYQRARPGITGLWQISGRSETRFSDRVSYDEWYILNWSLWYDVVIILHTIWIVVSGKGAF